MFHPFSKVRTLSHIGSILYRMDRWKFRPCARESSSYDVGRMSLVGVGR